LVNVKIAADPERIRFSSQLFKSLGKIIINNLFSGAQANEQHFGQYHPKKIQKLSHFYLFLKINGSRLPEDRECIRIE
jgi:hypothetical protein